MTAVTEQERGAYDRVFTYGADATLRQPIDITFMNEQTT